MLKQHVATNPDDKAQAWHVFNDFLVKPIGEDEALSFPGSWKIPAILYYTRTDCESIVDYGALALSPDTSILFNDVSIAKCVPRL